MRFAARAPVIDNGRHDQQVSYDARRYRDEHTRGGSATPPGGVGGQAGPGNHRAMGACRRPIVATSISRLRISAFFTR